jgi:hypothetical protein
MIRVYLQNCCKIIYTLIYLPKFLKGTSSNIVSTSIIWIQFHKLIAILYGLSESALLQKRRRPYEQSLFMRGILLQFLCAYRYQVVHV